MEQLALDFAPTAEANQAIVAVSDLPTVSVATSRYSPPPRFAYQTGDKFYGGFGDTQIIVPDLWTLRTRSSQVYETNLFGRGIISRLMTNIISSGMHLECIPNESLLGLDEDALSDWSEDVENRFQIWAKDPYLCDTSESRTFGQLQAQARREAFVEGDCLVTVESHPVLRIPRIRLTPGSAVQTPFGQKAPKGLKIVDGVEIDPQGRHVAFYVRQSDGTFKRLPAWGEKSGRKLAWLVYGTEKRESDVRGKPLLARVLQSLQEIDRYRDAAQRKALINAVLSLWVEKTQEKAGSNPFSQGAVGAQRVSGIATGSVQADAEDRGFKVADYVPGYIIDELQVGEKIHAHSSQGTDEKYSEFEAAIVQGIAWALEIPPSILRLSFNANYAASRGEILEFEAYLYKERHLFSENFCQPIYTEWLISEALKDNIKAPGLLDAWRTPQSYVEFGAWTASDFSAHIKPTIDAPKMMKGYQMMVEMGVITRDRAARETTGMKFSRVVKQLKRENEALVEANKPLMALEKPKGVGPSDYADADEDTDAPSPSKKKASNE